MSDLLKHIQRAVERAAECPAAHAEAIPVLEVFGSGKRSAQRVPPEAGKREGAPESALA